MGVNEDIIHLLTGQKRLKCKYKDQDMPKDNKADVAGMIEAIK